MGQAHLRLGGETFEAIEEIPIGALMELAAVDDDDPSALVEFRHFLFSVVEEHEEQRLKKLLRRKKRTIYKTDDDGEPVLDEEGNKVVDHVIKPITMNEINSALERLYEEMAARPTKPSSSSPTGSTTTKQRSQDGSSFPATDKPREEARGLPSGQPDEPGSEQADEQAPKMVRVVDFSKGTVTMQPSPESLSNEPTSSTG